MATIVFISSNGNNSHMESTNAYICDGHGSEVLVRTNRYLNDGHGLSSQIRGYGCPPDPELATQLMSDLRAKYEHNLAGRNTKGTNGQKVPVTHVHIIVSWHTDEAPSPTERHEMAAELIQRTKLINFPCLVTDHNNTDEDHIHISVGVYSLDGTRKLGMNNRLLYDLRRALDRICIEHGYSIVESPELWGDHEYKKWFDDVKTAGRVVIHPPQPRQKRRSKPTQKENYAASQKYARRENRFEPPPLSDKNRGSHFFCLPHLFDPNTEHSGVKQPLYIYAMDREGERRAPMQLVFDLEAQWCSQCLKALARSDDFAGKDHMAKRLSGTMAAAEQNLALFERLDIGTSTDLKRHMRCIGRDLNRCRQHIAEQNEAIAGGDEKAAARKEHSEAREAALRLEYRQLAKAQNMYDELLDAEQWSEYGKSLLKRAASTMTTEEQFNETIRHHYYDIGQLIGVPHETIGELINNVKTVPQDMILEQWTEMRANVTIQYTRTAAGLSAMHEALSSLYEQRREFRSAQWEQRQAIEQLGLLGIYFLPLILPLVLLNSLTEITLDRQIAQTRQLCEEIRWHNQNSMRQLNAAKSKCAILIAYGDIASAAQAWEEFARTCEDILLRESDLMLRERFVPLPPPPEPSYPDYGILPEDQWVPPFETAVRDYKQQILRIKADLQRQMEKRRWEEAHKTASAEYPPKSKFEALLQDARRRSENQGKQPTPAAQQERDR